MHSFFTDPCNLQKSVWDTRKSAIIAAVLYPNGTDSLIGDTYKQMKCDSSGHIGNVRILRKGMKRGLGWRVVCKYLLEDASLSWDLKDEGDWVELGLCAEGSAKKCLRELDRKEAFAVFLIC